ncbi:MAG: M23 family metallopeptidase [Candidatus Heimdallarchaeaceae archaeon]
MRKISIVIIILFILISGLGITHLIIMRNSITFNAGNRYDSTNLNYMDVIYENRSDIYAFNEGYSDSDSCPWGFKHQGIDYFLINNAKVLAASPGLVEKISWTDYGEDMENRFHVRITVRFNKSVVVSYNFEPWTQNPADKDHLLEMIVVQEGEWIELGQEIARILKVNEGAHIHFDVIQNNQKRCPSVYFSLEAYNELLEMIHSFHPDWDLCYP